MSCLCLAPFSRSNRSTSLVKKFCHDLDIVRNLFGVSRLFSSCNVDGLSVRLSHHSSPTLKSRESEFAALTLAALTLQKFLHF